MKLRWKSASLLSTPSRASSLGRKVVRKWCVPSACRKPGHRRRDNQGRVITREGRSVTRGERGGHLPEARAGHHDEAGRLEKPQAIELVGRRAGGGGGGDRARRQRELREEVHGALGGIARDARQSVERLGDAHRPSLERCEDRRALGSVGRVRGAPRLGRSHLLHGQGVGASGELVPCNAQAVH